MKLTTHLHLVTRLEMGGAMQPLPHPLFCDACLHFYCVVSRRLSVPAGRGLCGLFRGPRGPVWDLNVNKQIYRYINMSPSCCLSATVSSVSLCLTSSQLQYQTSARLPKISLCRYISVFCHCGLCGVFLTRHYH